MYTVQKQHRNKIQLELYRYSLFQFRYDIDTIFTKYRDIDIDIK